MGGRVVWLYGSEGLHEMRVLRGREGEVVWSYGSEGLHEMRVMRGWEGEGCLVICVKGDYYERRRVIHSIRSCWVKN